MLDKLLEILTEKKQRLDRYRPLPPELVKSLEDWLRVELTYSSNAIEGNTLSRVETAEVIERGIGAVISGKPLKDQLEAINHSKAVLFIKELVKIRKGHQYISEKDILDIHKIILTGIQDEWGGKYRVIDVFIRGSDTQFPRPFEVPRKMKEFIGWLKEMQEGHPVKIAADAHYKFVSIHPFIDGNGRVTRLLMNIILHLNGYPMAVIRNEDRTMYLQSFEIVRTSGNLDPFYNIVYSAVERSLDLYLSALKGKHPPLKKFIPDIEKKDKMLLKIGQLAKRTNESVHTIRFWTKEGLLKVKKHTTGGYQLYDPSMVEKAKEVRRLQKEKRLTIKEIKNKV